MSSMARIIVLLVLVAVTNTEWVVKHSGLPEYSKNHPQAFNISIDWSGDEGATSISLVLVQSDAVSRRLPLYASSKDGRLVQTRVLDLKHTAFYHDLVRQATISLTSFTGEEYSMRGSFLQGKDEYSIEPYNENIHKRSLSATKRDHVVKRQKAERIPGFADYKIPDEGILEYQKIMNSRAKAKTAHSKTDIRNRKIKRQVLPDVTYIIQIYLIIDFYAYQTLSGQASLIDWPNDDDDFVAYYMGHQMNEVDAWYRSINSSIFPVFGNWTLGVKLSYLQTAKTGGESTWTYKTPTPRNMSLREALPAITNWVDSNPGLPSDADHVMLITSLDLHDGNNTKATGLAHIGGICGRRRTSVVELTRSIIYARKLGNNMGAKNDGDENSCTVDDDYIMTDEGVLSTGWIRGFSNCSVKYFGEKLSALNLGTNCLTNQGSYIDTWADDSLQYPGPVLSVHQQCALQFGLNSTFAVSQLSQICQRLFCLSPHTATSKAKSAALRYTSCGNRKWCINERCVEDANAPETDEICPFGDGIGAIFSNSKDTCAEVKPYQCALSPHALNFCCKTCPSFATPWLGPSCPFGDTLLGCENLTLAGCKANKAGCCQTCCVANGPASGYSCQTPSTTTTTATTTTTTTTPTTTNATTSTTSGFSTSSSSSSAVLFTKQIITNVRTHYFNLILRITTFETIQYDCSENDLSDRSTERFLGLKTLVCSRIGRYVNNVTACMINQISCGSIILNLTVGVEEKEGDPTAPVNQQEIRNQLSGILKDSELGIEELPAVEDVDECREPSLNKCDSNAVCTNTDGYYGCACKPGYDDLSPSTSEPGRYCILSCGESCEAASRCSLNMYSLSLIVVVFAAHFF